MFACKFCEIFKNTFFHRTHQMTAEMLHLICHTTASRYAASSHLSLHCSKKSATNFPFRQSEGVKILKIFWPLDSNNSGICGVYIYCLSRNLVISTWTVSNMLYNFQHIFKLYFQNMPPILRNKYIHQTRNWIYLTCNFISPWLKILFT